MKRILLVFSSLFVLLACAQTPTPIDSTSPIIKDFNQRISDYLKLHKTALSHVHRLKPTNSPADIRRYELALAHQIREARHNVAQGTIFTSAIAEEFRNLIAVTMKGPDAATIRQGLRAATPVHLKALRVDTAYPKDLPLQSSPPSLLLNLPVLPKDLEYRIVGRALVLRDVDANLIVDFVTNAIS